MEAVRQSGQTKGTGRGHACAAPRGGRGALFHALSPGTAILPIRNYAPGADAPRCREMIRPSLSTPFDATVPRRRLQQPFGLRSLGGS